MDEPVPVIPLEYGRAEEGPARWQQTNHWLLICSWVCCLIASLMVLPKTESVVATGPIICALGVLIIVFATKQRRIRAIIVGALHCGVCVLFFVLVQLLHWGPD